MCKEVMYLQNLDFQQKTTTLTKRPSRGVRLQNNMKAKSE